MTLADLSFVVYDGQDIHGSALATFTKDDFLPGTAYRHAHRGTGSGQLVVRSTHASRSALVRGHYVRVRDLTLNEVIGGFFFDEGEEIVLSDHKTRAISIGGPSTLAYFARGVLDDTVRSPSAGPHDQYWIETTGNWHWGSAGTETYGGILRRVLVEIGLHAPDPIIALGTVTDNSTVTFTGSYEIPVGTDGLTAAVDLLQFGLDIHIDPDTFDVVIEDAGGFAVDRTGAFGAGNVRFEAAVNIAADLTRAIHHSDYASHLYVTGSDGETAQVIDPDYSSGDPIREAHISVDAVSGTGLLQDAGDREITLRKLKTDQQTFPFTYGSDEAGGAYTPGDRNGTGHFAPGDLVTLHTGTGAGQFNALAIEVAAWTYKLEGNGLFRPYVDLGSDFLRRDQAAVDRRIAAVVGSVQRVEFCEPAFACGDLTDDMLTAGTAVNGDAEDTGGIQWGGGSYTTAEAHDGTHAFGLATTTDGTITYTFDPAQVFEAGVRYVLDVWKTGSGTHDTNTVKFGVADGDEVVEVQNDFIDTDGGWALHRICWVPTADRTGVRLSYREQQTSGYFYLDGLSLYTTDNDELAGTARAASRCGHTHRAQDIVYSPAVSGLEATNVQAAIDELAASEGGSEATAEDIWAGDFIAGALSNPPTQAEVETVIGSPGQVGRGTVYGLQDSGTEKRYLALSDGVEWHIVPLVVPREVSGVAALTAAPAGGWAGSTHAAHYYNGVTYFAYVRGDNGNVEIRSYTHSTGTVSSATVMHAALLADLHAAPSIVVRQSDHRIHAFYSDHAGAAMYQWISTSAEDISAGTETNIDAQLGGTGYTYPMVADLESGLYLFVRYSGGAAAGQDWGYAVTTDDGTTWSALVNFYSVTSRTAYPFVQKTGADRADVMAIDGSSLESDDSIQFFSLAGAGDEWTAADGTVLTLPIGDQSEIVVWDGASQDDARGRFDVARGVDDHPRVLFASVNGSTYTYRHARWTGSEWTFTSLGTGADPGGGGTGGGARFDSLDTNIVYKVDASNEIVRLTTIDESTWASEALTSATTSVYPLSPRDHAPDLPALWLTGTFTDAATYSLGVTGFGASDATADADHLQRIVGMTGDEADVDSDAGTLTEVELGFASDSEQIGMRVAGTWHFAGDVTEEAVQAVGHYELLMTGSSTPEPLEDGTGTDWLYVWVNP